MKDEIAIIDILLLMKRHWWIILLSMLCVGLLSFVYSIYLVTPEYTSSGTLYVSNTQEKKNDAVDMNEINASQKLVNTYIEILRSNTYMAKISDNVGLGYSANQIKSMLSMNALNQTEILQIKVTNKNPDHAATILNEILANADNEIIRIAKAGSVEVIDEAFVPTTPSSPNIPKNTMVGLLLGAVLAMAVLFVIYMMDSTIHGETSLTDKYEIPVLGAIPALSSTEIKKGVRR